MADDEHTSRTIVLGAIDPRTLFGVGDEYLKLIEKRFPGVEVFARGHRLTVTGTRDEVDEVERIIDVLRASVQSSGSVNAREVQRVLGSVGGSGASTTATHQLSEPIVQNKGKQIRPQTAGQRTYVEAIDAHTITFGVGPAGTGKTFLAVAKAVQALQRREVSRIVLTRPAVEAGERLGYLPGTLEDKIDPYLRPLFDAITSFMDADVVPQLLANGIIEVAPLAYMRGRTLNEAFVILDEAQNTTPEQMKMFLTRLGFGSKMVVTGDITQIDLPNVPSGLKQAIRVLAGVEDLAIQYLTSDDIVRHSLVGRIVDAYDTFDALRDGRNDRDDRNQ